MEEILLQDIYITDNSNMQLLLFIIEYLEDLACYDINLCALLVFGVRGKGVISAIIGDQSHGDRTSFNTLWPRQNGRHFADDAFENGRISMNISLKFVP